MSDWPYPSIGAPSDWFNVKTGYNAIGNNVADDTAAIQAAVDAAIAAGGGTVYFPDGTYKTTSNILVNGHNVGLLGAGPNSNITVSASITTGVKFLNATGSGMRDMQVTAAGGTTITNLILITCTTSTEDLLFTNVHAQGTSGTTNCFGVGSDTNGDVSEIVFIGCVAEGGSGATWGWRVGNDVVGNVTNIRCYGCDARDFVRGVGMSGGALQWYGGTCSNNSDADFRTNQWTVQPCIIQGVRSENSNRFIHHDNGPTFSTPMKVTDCVVTSFTTSDKRVIQGKAPLTLMGFTATNSTADVLIYNQYTPIIAFDVYTNNPSSPWEGVPPYFAISNWQLDGSGIATTMYENILPLPQVECEPIQDERVQAGQTAIVQGLPYILDSGRMLDIKSGGVLALDEGLTPTQDIFDFDATNCRPNQDNTIRSGYSSQVSGLPYQLDAGRVLTIQSNAYMEIAP